MKIVVCVLPALVVAVCAIGSRTPLEDNCYPQGMYINGSMIVKSRRASQIFSRKNCCNEQLSTVAPAE